MPATTTINRYASVVSTLGRPTPSWVKNADDAVRVAAYDGYDDMYANVPDTFRVAMRGTNDNPVYVPSTRRIVEAVNRYLGKGWNWMVSSTDGNAANEEAARAWLSGVYTRNKMPSKFASAKRGMLKRGDAILHIIGRLDRPAGQRVQVVEVHPRTYFPIDDATDPEGVLGVYIVNLMTVQDTAGSGLTRNIAMRQEYRYQTLKGKQRVWSRLAFFETDAWDDRYPGAQPVRPVDIPAAFDVPGMQGVLDGIYLPASVTKIPVYHIVNNRMDEERFGTSEVAGMETLVAAKNQAVSDEDITLALVGLGLYVTTASSPVDEDGAEIDWVIAPGFVIELKDGETFEKVAGVADMKPYQDHIHTVSNELDESAGLSAVAIGNADAATAASGIALRLDMAPILANNSEKEGELLGVLDEIGSDLVQMWAPVDGATLAPDISVTNSFDDPLPVDRAATVVEITALVTAGLMSKEFAIGVLKEKLGYDFPSTMLDDISAAADAEAARVNAELALAAVNDPNAPGGPPAPGQPASDPTGGIA
jgi:hypothetical protein